MELGYYGSDRQQRMLRQRIQERWMDAYAPTRHVDPVLIGAALLLTAVGLVAIYSAKYRALQIQDLPTTYYVSKQLLSWGIALVGLVAAAVIDYRYVRTYAGLVYLGAVGLLVLVLSPLGTFVSGCQCWLSFGGFQLQPSELAKVALVIALAALLHERKGEPNLRTLLAAIAIVGVPIGLIVL
ncbi:MAG: FtsW/RodA/SpoVE family cell cycle protein, partial [Nitriliruptorales bacterium]